MKKLLTMAATAASFVFLGLALIVPARAEGPYIATYVGGGFSNDFSGTGNHIDFAVEADTGYVVGGALGHPIGWVPGLSAEIDLSYRNNDFNGNLVVCGDDNGLEGTSSTFAALANLRYTYAVSESINIYGLGGTGFAHRRISMVPDPDNFFQNGGGADEGGFAWQAGVGVDYAISKGTRLGVGYRYFVGPAIDRVAEYNYKKAFFEADGDQQDFLVTASFDLN